MPKKPRLPTVVDEKHIREAIRAKHWRTNVVKLKREELADLTGYTPQAVYLMERGINSSGRPVADWVWHRYRMACAAVEYQIMSGKVFNWGVEW